MSKRSIAQSLQDIWDAIGAIERFTAGMSQDELEQDEKPLFAVSRGFEIMGEAVKNIPESFRAEHPELPWKAIAGMRDKLIHNYWGIDIQVLWKTVQQDIPLLKAMIFNVLVERSNDGV